MSTEIVFPPGVVTGRPFQSMTAALGWLASAQAGAFGDFSSVAYGGFRNTRGGWTSMPIMSPVLPDVLVTVPAAGYDVVQSITDPYLFMLPADAPNHSPRDPSIAFVFGDDAPPQRPDDLLYLWRVLAGQEWAARNQFNSAAYKERRAAAKYLGWFENALAATADQFTAAANLWVSTVWVDAVHAGLTVSPGDPFAPNSPRHTAGTYILVTA